MYAAIVSVIEEVKELEGAKTIQLARIEGESVLLSKGLQAGQRVLFFPLGGALSPQFLAAHDLVRRTNPDGTKGGGYFEASGRVRAQTLFGVISAGFAMPLETALRPFGEPLEGEPLQVAEALEVGTLLQSFNGHVLCHRYLTPLERDALGGGSRGGQFPSVGSQERSNSYPDLEKHPDTNRLGSRFPASLLMADGDIEFEVTEKIHGTSGATGRTIALEEWRRQGKDGKGEEGNGKEEGEGKSYPLGIVSRSRNRILDMAKAEAEHKAKAERLGVPNLPLPYRLVVHKAIANMKLEPGETWYYEIAGMDENLKPIQAPVSLDLVASHPALPKVFRVSEKKALKSDYSYGWKRPRVFVYRVLTRNEDGTRKDLSYREIEELLDKRLGDPIVPWHYWEAETREDSNLFDQPPLFDDGVIPEGHLKEGAKSLRELLLYGMTMDGPWSGKEPTPEDFPAIWADSQYLNTIKDGKLSLTRVWGEYGPLIQSIETLTEGFVVRFRPKRDEEEGTKAYPFEAFKVVNPLFRASENAERTKSQAPLDPEEVS